MKETTAAWWKRIYLPFIGFIFALFIMVAGGNPGEIFLTLFIGIIGGEIVFRLTGILLILEIIVRKEYEDNFKE